jgi:ABC-type transport system involved in cytochrome c biogenesis permease subunit
MPLENVSLFCFEASYALALVLELLQFMQPRPVLRWLGLAFGGAGLLAHTLFLIVQNPPLISQVGSLLFLAWILAVFYLYGSIHHRRLAWGVFVLPVVLGLCGLAWLFQQQPAMLSSLGFAWLFHRQDSNAGGSDWLSANGFWSILHGTLFLLSAVGISVGFVASLMYLVQAHRLKAKTPPGRGLRLLSLERLEQMNRRAINLAFPLLTCGVLIGTAQMLQQTDEPLVRTNLKVVTMAVLWLSFAVLLYLRYGIHLRGRQVAVLTIVTFVLMLFFLIASHSVAHGGER